MAVSALKHEGVLYVRAVLVLTVQSRLGGARQQAIVCAPLGEGKVSATRNQRHVRAVLRPWATGFCVNPLVYAAVMPQCGAAGSIELRQGVALCCSSMGCWRRTAFSENLQEARRVLYGAAQQAAF